MVFQLCKHYPCYVEGGKEKVNCNDFYAFFECLYCFFFAFVLGVTVGAGGFINKIYI